VDLVLRRDSYWQMIIFEAQGPRSKLFVKIRRVLNILDLFDCMVGYMDCRAEILYAEGLAPKDVCAQSDHTIFSCPPRSAAGILPSPRHHDHSIINLACIETPEIRKSVPQNSILVNHIGVALGRSCICFRISHHKAVPT
jgi:hypothetical protein